MSAWVQNFDLAQPAALAPVIDGVDSLATAVDGGLNTAGLALDAASVLVGGAGSAEAAAAQALVDQARALKNDLFGAGFFRLVVHPWTPGVAEGEGPWRSLDFPRCAKLLADSFDDAGDAGRPQFSATAQVDMVAMIAGAPSPALFQSTITALNALINAKELETLLRRLLQAFDLEDTRFARTRGSTPPDWDLATVRSALPALAPVEKAIDDALAWIEAVAQGQSKAADIAKQYIDRKRAQLQTLRDNLAAASALLGQGLANAGIYRLHVNGLGGNALLQAALRESTGGAGPELSFCAGIVWLGGAGSLDGLKEFLGL